MKDFCFGEPRCSNKVKHSAKFCCAMSCQCGEVSCVNSSSAPRKAAADSSRRVRPALTLPYLTERTAEPRLRHRPIERNAIPRPFVQRAAIGRHSLLQPCHPTLSLPERSQRGERLSCVAAQWRGTRSRVFSSSAARETATASSRCAVPHSRSPSALSAAPRLFCVIAQSSGTRSRVLFLQRCVIGRHRLL